MKPVKAWAVVRPDGTLEWDELGPIIYRRRRDAAVGDSIVVRVEIREVPKKVTR